MAGNEAVRKTRSNNINKLRKSLFYALNNYLDDLGYLVDGSLYSLTFDICLNHQSENDECIKAIRCSPAAQDKPKTENLLSKLELGCARRNSFGFEISNKIDQ